MTKKATIYVRVSSERQADEDRVSIDAQLADCEALCKQKGYLIVGRYIDKEKYRVRKRLVQPSGQRKDRPQYQALIKAMRAGECDVVVAWKEDRLYRGMYAAMPFAEALDEAGKNLEVELVRETFDRRMLGIKAALGKIESDNIRERMIMGRRVRLERGEVPGGDQVRYGYRKVNKRLEIDEDEAAIARQVFAWYISGEGIFHIRRRLNGMGVPSRKGKRWSKVSVQHIVTGEYYATGRIPTTLDGETFYIPCPPIVSTTVWNKSLEIREANRWRARNLKEDYLCTGLVCCACGWKCHAKTCRSNRKRGYTSVTGAYRCPRYGIDPESMPPACAPSTGSKKVDDYVWNYVRRVCRRPDILQQALIDKIAQLQTEQGDVDAEADSMQAKVDELANERQWVITQARKKAITNEDMELQLAALEFQGLNYRKELERLQATSAARKQAEALAAWARDYLTDLQAGIVLLDSDPASLNEEDWNKTWVKLEAEQYLEKYSGDKMAAMGWAMLMEKRRVVRTLIIKVVVGKKSDGSKGRDISPELAFPVLAEYGSLASGDQSPEYKVAPPARLRLTFTPDELNL